MFRQLTTLSGTYSARPPAAPILRVSAEALTSPALGTREPTSTPVREWLAAVVAWISAKDTAGEPIFASKFQGQKMAQVSAT
jgi:hypothetical protein